MVHVTVNKNRYTPGGWGGVLRYMEGSRVFVSTRSTATSVPGTLYVADGK
jgi:hypothetical protein